MSNFLAPATVTATLKIALENALAADTSGLGGEVTIGRPDVIEDNGAGVNIYLYQVTPNAAWRNADLPTRNPRGALVQRPRVALDLHYLFTFYGDEANLEDQRLLGHVVSLLHEQPVLTRPMIQAALDDADFNTILAGSDLANEIEQVKFSPMAFNLEELSKLWSVFFQTPYHLSVAYSASVIFIERQLTPLRSLPVQTRNIVALPSVERAIAITPVALADLALWMRSDTGVTYDNNGVSLWEDQSGNENHAEQSAAGQRPAMLAHGLAQYPALHFDGVDDRLAIRNLNFSAPVAGVTVCAVVRSATAVTQIVASFDGDRYWELALSDGENPGLARWRTTDTAAATHNLASPDPLADPQTDTRWHVLCGLSEAGATPDKRFIVDGTQVAEATAHSGNSLGSGGVTRFGFIGAGSQADTFNGTVAGAGFFAGDLVELVIYTRALADGERDQLENYFAQRYG
jgi:hypothetical protein